MAVTSYAIALGSNRRSRFGSPADTLRAASVEIGVERLSSILLTPALGPAGRAFANAAGIVTTALDPSALLDRLKQVEHAFGRRGGRRWGSRVLDLDIVLWSEGSWADGRLVIPHPEFRKRAFVLEPLAEIAADWRDPLTNATVRQLLYRLARLTRPPRTPTGERTGP